MKMKYTKNFLIFNGKKIEYFIIGEGNKEVLCLQGWGLPPQIWFKFIEQISTEESNLKFIILDISSIDMETEITLSKMAEIITYLVSRIEFVPPEVIIGHSMGVTIMLEIMKLQLISPEKIVIVDSGVRSSRRNSELINITKNSDFMNKTFRNIVKSFFKNIPEDGLSTIMNKIETYDLDQLKKQLYMISSFDYSTFVKNIRIPALICYGKYDVNRNLEEVSQMHQMIVSSKFVLFKNSAHCPMYEEPDKFALEVLNFIK